MITKKTQRPKFYDGQYLGAHDMTAIAEYGRVQQARHALGAHTWGIAMGLELKEKEAPAGGGQVDVYLQPGYAWDGFGRPIVVLTPYKLPAEKFKSFVHDASIDDGDPEGRLIEVWLRYDESDTRGPRPGFEVCDPVDQFSRVQETFRVEVGERANHSALHDHIEVAGHSVDAQEALKVLDPNDPLIYDESIPHQTFPDGDGNVWWLIPLGHVRWKPNPDPTPGHFVKATADDREQSRRIRQYIGVVAEGIQAAGGIIRMRKRTEEPSKVWSDDLVWVEGNLRVDQDIKLFGGKLDFRDLDGEQKEVPLLIQREENNGQGGKDLRILIGNKDAGKNSLSIGPVISNNFSARLVVKDDGKVGIGTTTPNRSLSINTSGSGNVEGVSISYDNGESWGLGIMGTNNSNPGAFTVEHLDADNRFHTKFLVDTNGNVGIGTTNPNTKLQISDGSDTTLANASSGYMVIGETSGLNVVFDNNKIMARNDGSTSTLHLQAEGGDLSVHRLKADETRFIVKDNGRVGMGTTGPRAELEVRGSVRLHSNGNLFAPGGVENLRIIRGTIQSNGAIAAGRGFSVSRPGGAGKYLITFADPFSTRPSGSVTQVFRDLDDNSYGGDTRDNAVITKITTSEVRIITGDSHGDKKDRDFTFIIIGPR